MPALKKVLIVEDNQLNREILSGILSQEYRILEAENGKAALEILKEQGEDISIILLDIMMPVMDGYSFLSVIKKDPVFSSIPVIVTTQNDREADEIQALSHGASDFVAKPYRAQIILHRMAGLIHLRETAAMVNLFRQDRLTGLYSKEFFYQRVGEILLEHPEKEYDIVCSDIVNFKLVNDIFGTKTGDRLLRIIADLYTDSAEDRRICGRLNSDQFACLLERREDYADSMFLKATAHICEQSKLNNIVLKWGIYPVQDRDLSVEKMCDRAVLAASSIKGQYGRLFAVYGDELRNKLLREQSVTDSMAPALSDGQFEIYLQPKYRIKDSRLAGAEALVRWNHPEWGIQSPAEFIPLFEKNGFITKLDEYVWDRTGAVLRKWGDKGYPQLPISVNVSRADIYNADLADILTEILQKYRLPASLLHLEITESAYTENPQQIIDSVGHLRSLGFLIEMDDFGSGYSSLNMLNKMPIDILKLDRKFIQSEMECQSNKEILKFIMSLARGLRLGVVAEGVETREQLEHLRKIGCDCAQGYYYAKPMPVEDFEALLADLKAAHTGDK